MNQVEGIYDITLRFAIYYRFSEVWSTGSDPYTTTNASPALSEFTNYWNANQAL